MSKKVFKAGDKVRLTSKFLGNTGQTNSLEARKRWTVLEISQYCSDLIVVDEETDISYFTSQELESDPSLKYRRINAANLKIV